MLRERGSFWSAGPITRWWNPGQYAREVLFKISHPKRARIFMREGILVHWIIINTKLFNGVDKIHVPNITEMLWLWRQLGLSASSRWLPQFLIHSDLCAQSDPLDQQRSCGKRFGQRKAQLWESSQRASMKMTLFLLPRKETFSRLP